MTRVTANMTIETDLKMTCYNSFKNGHHSMHFKFLVSERGVRGTLFPIHSDMFNIFKKRKKKI